MTPTDEQQAIIDRVRSTSENIMVGALAGTGKTTTNVYMMLASQAQAVLCLAFNTRIVKDMNEKLKDIHEETGINVSFIEVRGLNSCGHRVWMKTIPHKIVLDKDKIKNQLSQVIKDEFKGQDASDAWNMFWEMRDAINWAKLQGYVPEGKFSNVARSLINREDFYASLDEELSSFCQEIVDHALQISIKSAYKGIIDFNDQIYMPTLFGGTFPRFPLVTIDEFQDLNATNHAMLEKLARGRIFALGDRWQSIYGFRGAVRGGMDTAKAKFNMVEMPLTNTFRCPEEIVRVARSRVPEYKSRKPGGKYEVLKQLYPNQIPDNAAIICRNNAPLFRTAFQLLRAGRSVTVAGSDIGPRILAIMRKLGDGDESQETTISLINEWTDKKLEKSNNVATIMDMAECMKVFARQGKTLSQAIAWGESLFSQQGALTLTTGHKAKGLEWDVVYHLDPNLIRKDDEQDLNLEYVIRTRSKDQAYEINSENIIWP